MRRRIRITGLHCASCVRRVEEALLAVPGVSSARADLVSREVTVDCDPAAAEPGALERAIDGAGFGVLRADGGGEEAAERERLRETAGLRARVLVSAAFAVPLLWVSMAPMAGISLPPWIARHGALIQFILCVPIVGAGLPLFRRGILAVLRTGRATMDTLVALGAGAAFLFSVAESLRHPASGPAHGGGHLYYETAGMLIAFILLGRWLEAAARGKTSSALRLLVGRESRTAVVRTAGGETAVPVEEVVPGDVVVVRPGEKVPVDGRVKDGES